MNGKESAAKVLSYLRARIPIVCIRSVEERRVEVWLELLAKELWPPRVVYYHTTTSGVTLSTREKVTGKTVRSCTGESVVDNNARSSSDGLNWLMRQAKTPVLLIMRDPVGDLTRYLRDALRVLRASESQALLVLLAPRVEVAPEVRAEVGCIDWPLPDEGERNKALDEILIALNYGDLYVIPPANRQAILDATKGLPAERFANVVALSIVTTGKMDLAAIQRFMEE